MSRKNIFHSFSWYIEDGIGHLEFSAPPANTMTTLFFNEFAVWISSFATDPELKAILIYGSGRHFSSGADLTSLLDQISNLTELKPGAPEAMPHMQNLYLNYNSLITLSSLEIPVIALISGVCIGSAFELALHCHFRLSSPEAVFGLPESTFGLMPGLGGCQRMASLAGWAVTVELALKGNTFSAHDAHKFGIIDALVPKKELLSRGTGLAMMVPHGLPDELRKIMVGKFLTRSDRKGQTHG